MAEGERPKPEKIRFSFKLSLFSFPSGRSPNRSVSTFSFPLSSYHIGRSQSRSVSTFSFPFSSFHIGRSLRMRQLSLGIGRTLVEGRSAIGVTFNLTDPSKTRRERQLAVHVRLGVNLLKPRAPGTSPLPSSQPHARAALQ
jgi:hypothetical protein